MQSCWEGNVWHAETRPQLNIQNDEKWGYKFHFAIMRCVTPLHSSCRMYVHSIILTNLELCSLSVLGRPIGTNEIPESNDRKWPAEGAVGLELRGTVQKTSSVLVMHEVGA